MISSVTAPWKPQIQLLHHDHRARRQFKCEALSKAGLRFFTSVAVKRVAGDNSATKRLIKKFVASSRKSVALDALAHLLSSGSSHKHLRSIVYPLYLKITEAPWFVWDTKLFERVMAFLDSQGEGNESAMLLSNCISKLESPERELALVYCELMESRSRYGPGRDFDGDNSAINSIIKKFVASAPKSVALDALARLLSLDSSHKHLPFIVYPLYLEITEAPWFVWDTKLVARVVAFLDSQCEGNESAMLLSNCISKLESRERELALFYCELMESRSRYGPGRVFDDCYARLKQITRDSTSDNVKRKGYKAMISGLCKVGRPREAEELIDKMREERIKVSLSEFRCVSHCYGRLGLFEEMQKSVDKMLSEGFESDAVSSNLILSFYGEHNKLPEVVMWLRKMKSLGIPFSIDVYNLVLNQFPSFVSLRQKNSLDGYPVILKELLKFLNKDEAMLVKELIGSSVLNDIMEWNASEGKLDLHGMNLGTAYLIMLQWMEELRNTFSKETDVIPAQITVVCGIGNHFTTKGQSRIKRILREFMFRLGCPMRIDRTNLGCFVARGKVMKEWMCS